MTTRHIVSAMLLSTMLAGCGIAARIELEKHNKELVAQSDAAVAVCDANFPKGNPKIAVSRIKCINDAWSIKMSAFGTDQDLVAAVMADAAAIAEKVQAGTMTLAEGNAAIATKWSQAVSESEHRANGRNSVAAQQIAAAAQQQAASAATMEALSPTPMRAPVTCIHTGNDDLQLAGARCRSRLAASSRKSVARRFQHVLGR